MEFLPLDKKIDRSSFECGYPSLNDYFRKYALQNHSRDIGKTFVALDDAKQVVGYYTLSAAEISRQTIPETHSAKLPKYPVPAVRIGQLAVDKHFQGKGIGEKLLMDAFHRAVFTAGSMGIYAIVVDAIDQKAVGFYHKYGFLPLTQKPFTLFLPIETVRELFKDQL